MFKRYTHKPFRQSQQQFSLDNQYNTKQKVLALFVLQIISAASLTGCMGGGGGSSNMANAPINVPSLPSENLGAIEKYNQSGLYHTNAWLAHQDGYYGRNINIGIVDSGIDASHIELAGKVTNGGDWQYGNTGLIDHNSHGTHVAGIVAAKQNNVGMMGAAPEAALTSYKLLNADGDSGSIVFHRVINNVVSHAISSDVAILNNSWGTAQSMEALTSTTLSSDFKAEIAGWRRAVDAGRIVVFAAGNNNRSQPSIHAGLPGL